MKKINIILPVLAVAFLAFGFIKGTKPEEGLNVGNKAPELKFKTPEGKEAALSSLKGKIVLVDFWDSWCGPCRMENPNVVAAYNHYKDLKFKNAKGFTIYSVSLDKIKEKWMEAIQQDKLSWPDHVSDLGWWQSEAAKIYHVQSIPTNFLLDANGVIVAKELRGPALDAELEKLLDKK